jgi:methyl-accepting chemotaxis protein
MKNMTAIEELIHTIDQLKCLAEQALDLVDEYSGGDSESADVLREMLDRVMEEHHAND